VIEEALLALTRNKPLYMAGLLGGATAQVLDAIEEKQMPTDFCAPTEMADLYNHPPLTERDPTTRDDRMIDRNAVWRTFQMAGVGQIAQTNGLTVEENRELFHTPVLDRVVELVLTGLSRLKANS
jgi:hypothetical protein